MVTTANIWCGGEENERREMGFTAKLRSIQSRNDTKLKLLSTQSKKQINVKPSARFRKELLKSEMQIVIHVLFSLVIKYKTKEK